MRLIGFLPALAVVVLACDESTAPATGDIIATGTVFTPATLTLTATDTIVTWGFAGGPHDVVFEDGAPGSGTRSSGTFDRNFGPAAPGTYRFRCTVHSTDFTTAGQMNGSVIVP